MPLTIKIALTMIFLGFLGVFAAAVIQIGFESHSVHQIADKFGYSGLFLMVAGLVPAMCQFLVFVWRDA